jgi:hypothetical protein
MNTPALLAGVGAFAAVLLLWPRKAKAGAKPGPGKTSTSSSKATLDTLTEDTRTKALELLARFREAGIDHVVVSTRRTCAEQNSLHAKGISPVRGCRSWHTHGRALDVMPLRDGKLVTAGGDELYLRMAVIARGVGFKPGLDFQDPVHFEYHPGLTISQVCPDPDACSAEPAALLSDDPLVMYE